jgi:amino acid adenylation domain-containing protein/FkbM family methyltransferase
MPNLNTSISTDQDHLRGFRLSPQQRRLCLLQRDGSVYNSQAAVLLGRPLAVDSLQQALSKTIADHEILRTTFRRLPGMNVPLQVIVNHLDADWRHLDWTDHDAKQAEQDMDQLQREELAQPFNLADGPLLRARLISFRASRNVLLVTLPSLCADSRTLTNLLSITGSNYGALLGQLREPLEPIQYVQFSEWQHEVLSEDDAAEGVAYWVNQDFREVLNIKLPVAERASSDSAFTAHVYREHLNSELVKAMVNVANRADVRVADLLFTAWQLVLWRLVDGQELAVGYIDHGRKYKEIENALGLFARCLPVRPSFRSSMTFSEALQQIKSTMDQTSALQEYFNWEPEFDTEQSMLEQSFFTYGFESVIWPQTISFEGVSAVPYRHRSDIERFKIKLTCFEQADAVSFEFSHDPTHFSAATIHRLAGNLVTALEGVVSNPDETLTDVKIVSDRERQELLVNLNQTGTALPVNKTIYQLIEEQTLGTPDAIAVTCEEQSLTYDSLNRSANQLAHYLRREGIGANTCVALSVERSLEMIVGMLGILKAGGAYVPLDPTYPQDRINLILEDAQVPLILTQKHLLDGLPQHHAKTVCLDADWESIARDGDTNPIATSAPEDLAYVIYTSGTTGRPKGVLVSQRNLVHSTQARLTYYEEVVTSFLLLSSFAFDSSVAGIFWTLCQGGNLCLPAEGLQLDLPRLAELIERRGISHLLCLPSLYSLLLKQTLTPRLSSLRCVIVAGEACPADLLADHHQALGHAALYNEYGPTEGTVWSSVYRSHADEQCQQVPIGRPIANTQIFLLDKQVQPVPFGVAGELYIGGAGLTYGYLHLAALTAEMFVPNPFSHEPGARLYRTGDVARYLSDGNIEFLGRSDNQIKLRGYRIELDEIRNVLRQHPAVEEAVVIVREDQPGDKRLTGYAVPSRKHRVEVSGHRRYKLPNGMSIVHQNKGETDFLYHDIFGDQIYLKHGIRLRDGDCVFDVGANIGMFTLFAGQLAKDLRIFAFEPIPPIVELLRINASLYGTDVKVFDCGLGREAATANFTYYPHFTLMSGRYADAVLEEQVARSYMAHQFETLSHDPNGKIENNRRTQYADELLTGRFESQSVQCPVRTLSSIVTEKQIRQIDLLKIDVERSESDVLAGIEDDHWAMLKQIVTEVEDQDGRLQQLTSILEDKGYRVAVDREKSLAQTSLYNVYATRATEDHLGIESTKRPARQISTSSSSILTSGELRNFVRERLPEYMVPSAFELLTEMPRLPNGKLNFRALPAPARGESDKAYVPPGTEMERLLVSIWSEALKLEQVGIHENFFDLGGHSFLAIKAHYRLTQEINQEVPLLKFFEHPTVHTLAKYLTDDQTAELSDSRPSRDWAEKRKGGLRRQRQMRGN